MRTAIKKTKVYKFNELSEEAQQTAIEKLYDININYEWYDGEYDFFKEDLKEIGIACSSFYFSLDRDYHIYMDEPYIENYEKFRQAVFKYADNKKFNRIAKSQWMLEAFNEVSDNISIETQHYAGSRASNYIQISNIHTGTFSDLYEKEAEELLKDKLEEFLNALQKQYEYYTSEEAIKETIEANDYEFTEEGELY